MNNSELDITHFFNSAAPMDYSASVAEIGRDAGVATWRAANDDSEDYPLLVTDEQRDNFKTFAKECGFSEAGEFESWSDSAINALCIQWIAGDMREAGLHADMSEDEWAAYEADENLSHLIYRGDDKRVYFYAGI